LATPRTRTVRSPFWDPSIAADPKPGRERRGKGSRAWTKRDCAAERRNSQCAPAHWSSQVSLKIINSASPPIAIPFGFPSMNIECSTHFANRKRRPRCNLLTPPRPLKVRVLVAGVSPPVWAVGESRHVRRCRCLDSRPACSSCSSPRRREHVSIFISQAPINADSSTTAKPWTRRCHIAVRPVRAVTKSWEWSCRMMLNERKLCIPVQRWFRTRFTRNAQSWSCTSWALFAWLISHQPAVLFSHNKPVNSTLLSEQTSTSHQPPANRIGSWLLQLKTTSSWSQKIFGSRYRHVGLARRPSANTTFLSEWTGDQQPASNTFLSE
jgi:hypothetical protein